MAYGKIKADAIVYDNSGSDVEVSTSSITSKANLASPAFTGTPTAPTAADGTNTTQIATTAFVQAAGGARKLVEQGSSHEIEFIAIGGGGAGAYTDSGYAGGGGGAGGLAYHSGLMIADGTQLTVTIGSGANGPTSDSQMGRLNNSWAPDGGDTTITGTGIRVEAYGGGGGAGYNGAYQLGSSGGCGGGSEGADLLADIAGWSVARQANGGTSAFGTAGSMGSGGNYNRGDGNYAAGGGGGVGGGPDSMRSAGGSGTYAFHVWLNATSEGVVSNSVRCIGGGGGGGEPNSGGGAGGAGGGGNGGNSSGSSGGDATHYTGSGGGGRGRWDTGSGRGGNGGNGMVIFRYPDNKGQKGSGGTTTQSGGYYYHVFKSGGTFTV